MLLLAPAFSRDGGSEVHFVELAGGLSDADVDVCVVAGSVDAELSPPNYVQVVPGLDLRVTEPAAVELERFIVDFAPRVVHAHDVFDQQFLRRLRIHAPVIQSIHNHNVTCSTGLRYFAPGEECHKPHGPACLSNALLRNCGHRRVPMVSVARYRETNAALAGLRQADGVIAYSTYVAKDLRNNGVANVSVLRLFVQDCPTEAPRAADPRKVLFVGRVVPDKGLDVLLRALVQVDAELEVWGDGWGMARCRRLCGKLGLDDRVSFSGWGSQADLHGAYDRCAVVAVPSVWPEPFGLVGLEAMVHERPVVASDTGGIGDWLEDGVNGFLVRAGDPDALAAGLERALSDPEHGREMGQRGREIALTEFSLEQHLEGLRSIYADAISRWKPAASRAG